MGKKMQNKLNEIKKLLYKYGYTDDEFKVEKNVININNLIMIYYDKDKDIIKMSFSSASFAIGAVKLTVFLHNEGIGKIKFASNFFISEDDELYFSDEADMKFKSELKESIIQLHQQEEAFSRIEFDYHNETFH